MKTNKFGEIVFQDLDLCDLIMQGRDIIAMPGVCVEPSMDVAGMIGNIQDPGQLRTWAKPANEDLSVDEFDKIRQSQWFMPDQYKDLDIAAHVLSLCSTQEQLQRVGEELLLYQQHDLFDLLRYLKYFVDVLRDNHCIWGVGRGSSVASYVLYLLGVHRIDSMHYDLDPREFLR